MHLSFRRSLAGFHSQSPRNSLLFLRVCSIGSTKSNPNLSALTGKLFRPRSLPKIVSNNVPVLVYLSPKVARASLRFESWPFIRFISDKERWTASRRQGKFMIALTFRSYISLPIRITKHCNLQRQQSHTVIYSNPLKKGNCTLRSKWPYISTLWKND